jgi:hypothetical protein
MSWSTLKAFITYGPMPTVGWANQGSSSRVAGSFSPRMCSGRMNITDPYPISERKPALAADSWNTTVLSSGAVSPDSDVAEPSWKAA